MTTRTPAPRTGDDVPHGDRVASAIGWTALAVLAWLTYLVVRPFLVPLGWATVMAVVFYPVHARFERRWRPGRAAALSTILVTLIVVVPLLLVMAAFVNEALAATGDVQRALADGRFGWIAHAWNSLTDRLPESWRPDLATFISDTVRRAALWLAAESGSVLRNTVEFIFDLVLALFATFFFLRDSHVIVEAIRRLLPLDDGTREGLMAEMTGLIAVSVRAAFLVAVTQGVLGGIVFALVGIDAPVFWGVVMAFFCLLPFGAWVVWLPAAIVLAASGEIGRAIVVAALGAGIVSAVDNVLRPMLLAGHTSMNGLVIFVSLLGGMAAFGPLGLVLGPLVLATAMALATAYVGARRREPPSPVH